MSYRTWGDNFEAADLTGTAKSQKLTPQASMYLGAVRVGLVVYNNPVFTSLNCKIYSDEGGLPRNLLYTSTDTISKSELITEDNGVKECYFSFDSPSLSAEVPYHIVINGVGYTPTADKFISWQKAFPNSAYTVVGGSEQMIKLGVWPYNAYLIGSRI